MFNDYVIYHYMASGYIEGDEDILIDWGNSVIFVPKMATSLIQSNPSEIRELSIDTFRLILKDLEDNEDGIVYTKTHNHNTSVTVGGVTLARVIEILEPYTVTFEDGQYAVNLIGANSNIGDRVNVNQASIRVANSAGLVQMKEIEYSTFQGGVTIDVINGTTGTNYPKGTPSAPVNNLEDASLIATTRGLKDLFVIGHLTLPGNDFDGFNIRGRGAYIITSGINNAKFYNCWVQGSVGNRCWFDNCSIGDLIVVTPQTSHFIYTAFAGTLSLSGSQAIIVECVSAVSGEAAPIIDFMFTNAYAEIRGYTGNIELRGKNTPETVTVDMTSGKIILNNTLSGGIFILRGSGELIDNSSPGASITYSALMNPANITATTNRMIEGLRPHHQGTGNTYFWDPSKGDDSHDGKSPSQSIKTFAKIHDDLVVTGNHDIIIAMDTVGGVVADEAINITKNYVFLRGPGRGFKIKPTTNPEDTIHVTGTGCEVAGFLLETDTSGAWNAIHVNGANFTYIKDIWIDYASGNGVRIENSVYSIFERGYYRDMNDHGIDIGNGVNHLWINIDGIHSANGDGIHIQGSGIYEVKITGDTDIHWCSGYGINIASSGTMTRIGTNLTLENNSLGRVNDPGNKIIYEGEYQGIHQINGIWNEPIANHTTSGTFGEFIGKKLLTFAKYLGAKE